MNVTLLWLINEKNEVLLARRAAGMDSDADVWGLSVSGTVESGETYEEALLRETREELGIPTDNLEPLHLHDEIYGHKDGKVRKFGFFYAKTNSDIIHEVQLEPAEVAEVRWISVPKLKELYKQHPESIIISDAEELWQSIFNNLDSALSRAV